MPILERRPLVVAIAALLSSYMSIGQAAAATGHSAAGDDTQDAISSNTAKSIPGGAVPGITIDPEFGLETSESGDVATFSVVLDTQPAGTVSIHTISNDIGEVLVDQNEFIDFDGSNWNVPRQVRLAGVDDPQQDGNVLVAVELDVSSDDPDYDALPTRTFAVLNRDDADQAMLVTPVSGLVTHESGLSQGITVVLRSPPLVAVNVIAIALDGTEGYVEAGSRLVFDPGNWFVPQTIIVRGVDDVDRDGDIAYTIRVATASTELAFNGRVVNVAAINLDDERLVVTAAQPLVTREQGNTATFTVVLGSSPAEPVNVIAQLLDGSEGVILQGANSHFTDDDWYAPRTVVVAGLDDDQDDGDIAYNLLVRTVTAAPGYAGQEVNVAVINIDDETTATALAIAEVTPSPSRSIEPVTVRVALTEDITGDSGLPLGNVFVATDTGEVCEIDLPGDSCTMPPVSTLGPRTLTASYSGTATHASSSSAVFAHDVVRRADLSVTTLSVPSIVLPGMAIDYISIVANAGPDAAPGTRVLDPVPAGLLGAHWTCFPVGGGVCDAETGSGGIDRIVDIEPGASLVYALSGTVSTPDPATITNAVSVTPMAAAPGYVLDADAEDQSDEETDLGDGFFSDGFEIDGNGRAIERIAIDRALAGVIAIDAPAAESFDASRTRPRLLAEWLDHGTAVMRLDALGVGDRELGRISIRGNDGLWNFGAWKPLPRADWSLRWWRDGAGGAMHAELP